MVAAPAFAAEPITGTWYTKGKRAVVTIDECGSKICGRITRFIEKPKDGITTDVNNPDAKLRKRKLVGLPVLTGFYEDGSKWRGEVYDPESGKTYRSVVQRNANGTLEVEGCVTIFCRGETWTRVR